jgi:hypothetical protein
MGLAELARGVGECGKRERAGEEREIQNGPDREPAETAKQGCSHTRAVCKADKKKPIGQGY